MPPTSSTALTRYRKLVPGLTEYPVQPYRGGVPQNGSNPIARYRGGVPQGAPSSTAVSSGGMKQVTDFASRRLGVKPAPAVGRFGRFMKGGGGPALVAGAADAALESITPSGKRLAESAMGRGPDPFYFKTAATKGLREAYRAMGSDAVAGVKEAAGFWGKVGRRVWMGPENGEQQAPSEPVAVQQPAAPAVAAEPPRRFVRRADGTMVDLDGSPDAVPMSERGVPGSVTSGAAPDNSGAVEATGEPAFPIRDNQVIDPSTRGRPFGEIMMARREQLQPGQMRMVLPDGTTVTRTGQAPAAGQVDSTELRAVPGRMSREAALAREGYNLRAMAAGGDGGNPLAAYRRLVGGGVPLAGVGDVRRALGRYGSKDQREFTGPIEARRAANAEAARQMAGEQANRESAEAIARTEADGQVRSSGVTAKGTLLAERERRRAAEAGARGELAGAVTQAQQKNQEAARKAVEDRLQAELSAGLFDMRDADGNIVKDSLRDGKGKVDAPRTDAALMEKRRRELMVEAGLAEAAPPPGAVRKGRNKKTGEIVYFDAEGNPITA